MKKAFLFDLDGTLIASELLPAIAADLGIYDEINELTQATMAGDIPFDQSFRYRVELLESVPESRVAEIILSQPVHNELMDWVLTNKERCWVVTGNLDCWIRPWLEKYGLRGYSSISRRENGKLVVSSILHKASVLSDFKGYYTCFVGDGANDAEIMRNSNISIACSLIHPAANMLLEIADFVVMKETTLCRILSRL